MSKNWRETEILIGVLISLLGIFIIWGVYIYTSTYINYFRSLPNPYYGGNSLAFWSNLLTDQRLEMTLGLSSIIGGILLILSKKTGWFAVMITNFYFLTTFITGLAQSQQPSDFTWFVVTIIGCIGLLIALALTSNPFRKKFQIKGKDLLMIIGILMLLFADRYLLNIA